MAISRKRQTLVEFCSKRLEPQEALHITWNKPDLNKQVKCYATTLCI